MTDRHTGAPTDDSGAQIQPSGKQIGEVLADMIIEKHKLLKALKPLARQFDRLNLLADQGLLRGSDRVPEDRAELVGQPAERVERLILSVEDAIRLARAWREAQG